MKNKLPTILFLFLFSIIHGMDAIAPVFVVNYGKWIPKLDSSADEKLIEDYRSQLEASAGEEFRKANKNFLLAHNNSTNQWITMVSGMFPFFKDPDPQVIELIDCLMSTGGLRIKYLNAIREKLEQIQGAGKNSQREDLQSRAQSILDILDFDGDVLEGIFDGNTRLVETLEGIVEAGRKKGLAAYIMPIRARLCEDYVAYIRALIKYFGEIRDFDLVGVRNNPLADEAIRNLDDILKIFEKIQSNPKQFSVGVTELQSVSRFQNNAHELVHTETILLHSVLSGNLALEKTGIRFFTQNDMCERCENIVCNFANREIGNPFIVLSKEQYMEERKECPYSVKCEAEAECIHLNSRKRDNLKEKTLFKFELK